MATGHGEAQGEAPPRAGGRWCAAGRRALQRTTGWLPVALMGAALIYLYYVVVVDLCFETLLDGGASEDVPQGVVLYLVFFHIVFVAYAGAFAQTTWTAPASPLAFTLRIDGSPAATAKDDGGVTEAGRPVVALPRGTPQRYCGVCDTLKPERCHHCSTCNRCILKMDHHCPWFNNCIGFANYKLFLLTLLYAVLLNALSFAILLAEIIAHGVSGEDASPYAVQFLVVAVLTGLCLLPATGLLVYHGVLVVHNRTTIEEMDRAAAGRHTDTPYTDLPVGAEAGRTAGPHAAPNPYDVGLLANVRQALGTSAATWLIPMALSRADRARLGDGLLFPKASQGEVV